MANGIICNSDGNRLNLGNFDENGLGCYWYWDEDRGSDIGVFALGVETLGPVVIDDTGTGR